MADAGIDAAARAAIRAQTQTQIGLSIPAFNGNKPYTIQPEQWIQRITQAQTAGAWTNEQTMGFVATGLTDSALKWYNALEVRGINPQEWEEVKEELLICYGTQINATNTCKGITKLHQGSRSVLDYFSEVGEVIKMLVKLTPKDYETDLTIPDDIILEAEGANADVHTQLNRFNGLSDENKLAIKKHWGEKVCLANTHFIMVQIFVEGLKPELKHEMNKQAWLTIHDAFRKAQTLEKLAEQKKAQSTVADINVDYVGPQSGRGTNSSQNYRGQSRGGRGQNQAQQGQAHTQNNNVSNNNNSATTTAASQRGRGQGRGGRGRGQNQRGRGNNQNANSRFPSAAGKQCRYCLKYNHFAKDCRDRIAKGHAIPLADIEEGLYNDDYFTTPQDPNQQDPVDGVHETFKSKN